MKNRLKGVKGVLDGIRAIGSASQSSKSDLDSLDFEENLKSEHFNIAKIVCHGFPNAPSCIAFDPIQKLLAIGTKNGSIRILGRAGVDCHLKLEKEESVKQLIFIINEGGLISIGSDNTISLWTIRQKKPTITLQTQFSKREDVNQAYLPFQSKFLYIGTTQGNVYFLNVENFSLSGYIINWNKVIGMMQSVHPGPVVHLSESPLDSNRLLIGFRKGLIVLWDLQKREAVRFKHTEELCSVSWHYEGRMFISSHSDGSLVKWSLKNPQKPAEVVFPHANLLDGDDAPTAFKQIRRVFWLTKRRESADLFLFSGGSPLELSQPCVNIQLNNHIDVLQMEHEIVDIVPLCDTPFNNDMAEPYAVAVLQENDLAVIDLTSDGYPNFENPYPMDLHESAVTACHYVANCPPKLIEAFFMVGRAQKHSEGFSSKQWPVTGGEWGDSKTSYSEILITGHADGSLKFWDATLLELQALYRVRTAKYFEPQPAAAACTKPPSRQTSHEVEASEERTAAAAAAEPGVRVLPNASAEEDPFAVRLISFDSDCQRLVVAGATHVCLLSFSRKDHSSEILTVDLCIESFDDSDLHEDFSRICSSQQSLSGHGANSQKPPMLADREIFVAVAVRRGCRRWGAGYQPELICRLGSTAADCPPHVTAATFSSEYQILAVGNDNGVALVDLVQACVLLTLCTPDLYGSLDPYARNPRSPSSKKEERLQASDQQRQQQQLAAPAPVEAAPAAAAAAAAAAADSAAALAAAEAAVAAAVAAVEEREAVAAAPAAAALIGRSASQWRASQPAVCLLDLSGEAATQRHRVGREKPDSFSRSCSSSTSSLEHSTKEAVVFFAFADTYARKTDSAASPCVWIGTSLGSVFIANLQLPSESRTAQPVIVSPSGTVIRLLGSIRHVAFLNSIIPPTPPESEAASGGSGGASSPAEQQDRPPLQPPPPGRRPNLLASQRTSSSGSRDLQRQSTTGSGCGSDDRQLVCLCSDKQVRVLGLPSQTCYAKKKLTETSAVVSADVPLIHGAPCLVCLLANGHVIVNSLPSLRPLMDVDYAPFVDFRMGRTFQCSSHGQAVYFSSPSELQKITLSSEMSTDLNDMLADLYIPCDLPEPPKKTIFEKVGQNLFGGGGGSVDREQLFGDSAGKAAAGICKVTRSPNTEALRARAEGATSEIGNALQKGLERGEKLGEVDEQTERMRNAAEAHKNLAGQLAQKYKDKDKKWWPF